MDYLWSALTVAFGENIFQRSDDIGSALPPPIPTFFMLTESGDRILTETGDFMILEQAP